MITFVAMLLRDMCTSLLFLCTKALLGLVGIDHALHAKIHTNRCAKITTHIAILTWCKDHAAFSLTSLVLGYSECMWVSVLHSPRDLGSDTSLDFTSYPSLKNPLIF